MNWLMYIGGGWLYFILTTSLFTHIPLKNDGGIFKAPTVVKAVTVISIISVWFWICWRLIK